MYRQIRQDGNVLSLDGYPDGAAVHGIAGPLPDEIKRLMVFAADLRKALEWLTNQPVPGEGKLPEAIAEAMDEAALLAFCRCFESTAGVRLRPLKAKKIFNADQRASFDRLRTIRNKVVAHDEQLTGALVPLMVKSKEFHALDALCIYLTAPFSAFTERANLLELVQIAHDWVEAECNRIFDRITTEFDALPLEVRAADVRITLTPEAVDVFGSKPVSSR